MNVTPQGRLSLTTSYLTNEVQLRVAPVDEQRRILATIEEQFSRLDAGVAALERVRANLKSYRAAILKAAVEGRLTEAWREKNPDVEPASELLERILRERRERWEREQLAAYEAKGKKPPQNWRERYKRQVEPDVEHLSPLPGNWCWATLEQLANVGTGATPLRGRPDYYEDGTIPWVTSGALNNTYITEATEYITEKALAETNVKLFPAGSLLVAMYGEGKTRGKVAQLSIDATTNQACAALVFTASSELVRSYARLFLLSNYLEIRRFSAGGVQPNLNLSIIKKTPVALPPLKEQEQFIKEVERRFSVLNELETQVEANLKRVSRLRQSILKRAFEGELVPQDLSDEPATDLLERIRKERERSAALKQGRGKKPARITEGSQASLFSGLGGGR